MVATTSRTVFNPAGNERVNSDNSLVSVAPNLPLYVEVKTGSLKAFLQKIYKFNDKDPIQKWLEARQRTGFYFEINQNLHLAFADQRDGKRSEYWWFLYYNNVTKPLIFENIKIEEHQVSTRISNNQERDELTWNGVVFSSKIEKRIAHLLSMKNIVFFTNLNAFMDSKGMPVSNTDNREIEKTEVDFLVFHNQKSMILEIDGEHHRQERQWNFDHKRDRIFLKQGISTVRFSYELCNSNPSAVVDEFLSLFN